MESICVTPYRIRQADAIIIGGGTTGVCAALGAARAGVKALLVEKNGFIGGNAATGLPWLGFHGHQKEWLVKGIPYEIVSALQKEGGATPFAFDPICRSAVGISAPMLKKRLAAMLQEAGVSVLLHAMAFQTRVEEGRLKSIYVMTKQGCEELRAPVFIDTTDSGDIAALAGVPMELGREEDHRVQVSSAVVTLGNVDVKEMIAYFRQHPDQIRPFPLSTEQTDQLIAQMEAGCVFIMGAFPDLIAKAKAAGYAYARDRIIGSGSLGSGELVLVNSRVEQVNMNDADNLTAAELLGLAQTDETLALMRDWIPGCKNARLVSIGHQLGVRETRHMEGCYRLTGEDLMRGNEFPDMIAHGAYHLDVHSPDHNGLETQTPPTFHVPYRCLIPRALNGLLVAGRALSANQQAQSAIRVIPIAGSIGQSAGCAAAIAIKNGQELRDIAPEALAEMRKKQQMI